MYIIKEIRITGISKQKVRVETKNIEDFRHECALAYKVKKKDVKFMYEERG